MAGPDRVNDMELPKHPLCVTDCIAFPLPPHHNTPHIVLKSS